MIKTAQDFEGAIEYISKPITDELYNEFKYQGHTMNSENYNTTMVLLEKEFNILYEKIRLVQDVIDYSKEFVEQNIYTTIKEAKATISSLEDSRDSLKKDNFITYDIPFIESSGRYTDRDSLDLSHCDVNNNVLTLSGDMQYEATIANIFVERNAVNYKENSQNLISKSPYRSFYVIDKPIKEIIESVLIVLESPAIINFLEIIPSNCKIEAVSYMSDNDVVNYEDDFTSGAIADKKIKAISFKLVTSNYKKLSYKVDTARMATDFWTKLKDYEYNRRMGINSVFDLDKESGIQANKDDYAAYLKAIENWKAAKIAYETI
jgi:hypothetical protein